MRASIILTLLLFSIKGSVAQNYPYKLETVVIDKTTGSADKIPFDKPFIVEFTPEKTDGISMIFVYEMEYKLNTGPCFKRQSPDIKITKFEVKDKKVIFTMPALKPQKYFSFVLIRKETQPFQALLKLNKMIFWELSTNHGIANSAPFDTLFTSIKNNYKGSFCNLTSSSVIPADFAAYLKIYKNGLQPVFDSLDKSTGFCLQYMLNDKMISDARSILKDCCRSPDSSFYLAFCDEGKSADQLLKGFASLSDLSVDPTIDTLNLPLRIDNLESTIKTLETWKKQVTVGVSEMKLITELLCNLDSLMRCLKMNRDILNKLNKKALAIIDNILYGQETILGTTYIKDLETASSNRFLLDLGVANIDAWDNRNKFTYIPRLAWGANILFRPVDKNVPLVSLPGSIWKHGNDISMLSEKSFWHVFSLYIGFTIGSIPEPEFDNFYNNTSILLGPSIRLYKALHISAGSAFIKRINPNPVLTRKQFAIGEFVTVSLDVDFLKTVNSLTGLLTSTK
jgi:hypothetical protein